MTKRRSGLGSITPRKGRFWARAPRLPDGRRPSLGVYDTIEEAEDVRAAAVNKLAESDLTRLAGVTLRAFGVRWLEERELDSDTSAPHRRARWGHVLEAPFIDDGIATITAPVVLTWVKALKRKKVRRGRGPGAQLRTIARATVRVVVGTLSQIFTAAVAEGLAGANPAAGIVIRGPKDPDEVDVWTYLSPDEQRALWTCERIAEPVRLMIGFAIGTGVRQGEQFNLELRDLHVEGDRPHAVVRWGSQGRRPKNGKIRTVPLFGVGLEAARRWLEVLPRYARANPGGLVFPKPSGKRRRPSTHLQCGTGNKVDLFKRALEAAGIARHVRWHDMRHTCASSLIAGWWGPPWRLEEVRDMLGHTSIRVTERYAHLAPAVLGDLAARTGGLRMGDVPKPPPPALPGVSRSVRSAEQAELSGSCCSESSPAIPRTSAPGHPPVTQPAVAELAVVGLRAMVRRDLAGARQAADEVIEAHPVARAAVALQGAGEHEEARLAELFEAVLDQAPPAANATAPAASAPAPAIPLRPGLAQARPRALPVELVDEPAEGKAAR